MQRGVAIHAAVFSTQTCRIDGPESWPLALTPTVTVRSGMSASSELSASAAGLNMPFRLTRWRQDRRLSLFSFGLAASRLQQTITE